MFILIFCIQWHFRTRFKPTYAICWDQWELYKIEINVVLVTRLVVLKGYFSLCVHAQLQV